MVGGMTVNLPDARPAAGTVYRHTVEAMLTHVVQRHQVMTAQELREKRLDKPRDLSREDWAALVKEVARRKSSDGTLATGLEWAGREMMKGYAQGLVGRGVLMVARLLGPRRALLRLADSYSTADDMTKVYGSEKGERHVELLFNDIDQMPTYVRGTLSEALLLLGVQAHDISFELRADGYTRFDVTWK